ncbi:hypothetical protein HOLDEFILI_00476 [Holdemania filiformis DSM 12042]|uniref:Uncharacterized protein n=1 Tax=Holdemania filiformis DSM 12042 TaxID=545696 RepID=B9Y3U6_9FIRM|nr:hypothetical protein HOLDEFILI_00476 [Holdemania filiformis DSM 12042]
MRKNKTASPIESLPAFQSLMFFFLRIERKKNFFSRCLAVDLHK